MKSGRRRQWHPTPVLLPGKSHGWRSLVGCSPWGLEESDMTERLHFYFSLLCIREGNGNPLQYSCLEHPRDGVTQSRTRLKWLSSSSSSWKMVNGHYLRCSFKIFFFRFALSRFLALLWFLACKNDSSIQFFHAIHFYKYPFYNQGSMLTSEFLEICNSLICT